MNYRWSVSNFFNSIYGTKQQLNENSDRYFSEGRDYQADVQGFLSSISAKPPKSVRLMISAIKTFLIENDIELSEKYWRRLSRKVKGNRAATLDSIPSNLELKQIMNFLPPHGKALYLTLSSSGMRIGEALQLEIGDLELEEDPVKVSIRVGGDRQTKSGNSRIAFISGEAKEAIVAWLRIREDYLRAASGKSHLFEKSAVDDRLFPFLSDTAYEFWNNAVLKAGLLKRDKTTNRMVFHPHVLRKFFRTRLGAVIPVDIVEALEGHEGYLTEVYRKYSEQELAEFYKKGEPSLSVFTDLAEVSKLKVEVESQNKQLQTVINSLAVENIDLKKEVSMVNSKLSKIESQIQPLLSYLDSSTVEKLSVLDEIQKDGYPALAADGGIGLSLSPEAEEKLKKLAERMGISERDCLEQISDLGIQRVFAEREVVKRLEERKP